MKKLPRGIVLLAVGVLAGATLATGATVAIEAGASGTSTNYYACLSTKGALSKVGLTSPTTCPKTSTVINWDSQGPQGIQGVQGLQGPAGTSSGPTNYTWSGTIPTSNISTSQRATWLVAGSSIPAGSLIVGVSGSWTSTTSCPGNGVTISYGPEYSGPGGIPAPQVGIASDFTNAIVQTGNFRSGTSIASTGAPLVMTLTCVASNYGGITPSGPLSFNVTFEVFPPGTGSNAYS